MVVVLVTGFVPFGDGSSNPSGKLARSLDGRTVAGAKVRSAVLPVSYGKVAGALLSAIEKAKPDIVIGTGLWGGRTDVTIERVALNLAEARIKDNDEYQPIDRPLVEGGPAAYFLTIPVRKISERLRSEEICCEPFGHFLFARDVPLQRDALLNVTSFFDQRRAQDGGLYARSQRAGRSVAEGEDLRHDPTQPFLLHHAEGADDRHRLIRG